MSFPSLTHIAQECKQPRFSDSRSLGLPALRVQAVLGQASREDPGWPSLCLGREECGSLLQSTKQKCRSNPFCHLVFELLFPLEGGTRLCDIVMLHGEAFVLIIENDELCSRSQCHRPSLTPEGTSIS